MTGDQWPRDAVGPDESNGLFPMGARKPPGKGTRLALGLAAVVLLAIGFGAGRLTASSAAQGPSALPAGNSGSPSAGLTPAAQQTTSGAQTTSAVPTGNGSAGPEASGVGTVNLVDLTAASGAFKSNDTNPLLNGQAQLFALTDLIGPPDYGGLCNPSAGDAGYNLGRDYTTFTALAGVDDNSQESKLDPTVEIDGDGLKLATYTPTLGHPAQVSVNITGVLRLEIKWSDPGAPCDGAGYLVIGNGQLTTIPGFHPSPAAPQGN